MDISAEHNVSKAGIPARLSQLKFFERSSLLQTMKKRSDRVCIIEGPSLYGKSVLAYQYVHSLCDNKKICWVDAQKKLFLHSFSKRELLHKLCMTLGKADVVVFDALPMLDAKTLRVFSFLLSYLVNQHCEIVITCKIKPDLEEQGFSTCLLRANDLLLTDDELKEIKRQGKELDANHKGFETIPFVAFYPQKDMSSFASLITKRTVQNELELFESLLICFGQGTKTELASLFNESFMQRFNDVAKRYPHCGVRLDLATFSALPLSLYDRCLIFKNSASQLLAVSLVASVEDLAEHAIRILIRREQFSCALLLAKEMLPPERQLVIFQTYGRLCIRCGHSQEVVDLVEAMGEGKLKREIDLLYYAQALGNIGNSDYCSMVLTRVGDLHTEGQPDPLVNHGSLPKDFSIDLLSGFRVTRLGEPFPQSGAIRSKARILLTLLVLNHKRELSRNWLGRVLWPDSSEEKSRQNFYNLWSYTKRLFERGKGNCPYFISTPQSIQLNADYVDSDIISLEKICDDLINGRMPSMGYGDCLEWIERVCCSSLLPGADCSEISAQSRVLRNRLVDALMAASGVLAKQKNIDLSTRFIQKAFLCDSAREDSCYMLMKIFRASGQYSKAINVFVRHRNTMIDRYGVENSKRVGQLYEEILEELS